MGKQSPKALKPQEIEAMARQQNYMNNPNVSNMFGSTNTVFDGNDQASITQTMSPEMQGLINSQMDFVAQGPAQLGNFSNPFLEGIMQNTANSLARTGGWGNTPQSSMMGGFNSQMPQFGQPPTPEPQAPTPDLSFGLQGSPQGNPQPTVMPQQGGFDTQALASALGQMSGGGGAQSPYQSMGANIGQLLQKQPQKPEGY